MRYLLDTCVISDFLSGQPGVVSRLKSTPPEQIAVSVITWFEVEYGLRHNPAKAPRLRPLIDALRTDAITVNFTLDDAMQAGVLRAELRGLGTPIGAYDVLLAGSALYRNLVMVTSNIGEFSRVPNLQVEDWRV